MIKIIHKKNNMISLNYHRITSSPKLSIRATKTEELNERIENPLASQLYVIMLVEAVRRDV